MVRRAGPLPASTLNIDLLAASASLGRVLGRSGCRRFVGVGTCFEYDVERSPLSEDAPTRPCHLYSASKLSLFLLLQQIGKLTGMEVAWARLFYLYGPWEDERRLVASVASALARGERVELTPGEQVRDFLHVADVGSALATIAAGDLRGAVNVASGEAVSVREVAETLAGLAGRQDLVVLGARAYSPGDPMTVLGDPTRLRSQCAWRPSRSLREGLAETLGWWRERTPT